MGFTLAELLISLAILGVIASFTIPKVIASQQNQKYNAIVKESASAMVGAYQQYAQQNTVSSTFSLSQLTPYINYVALDTSASTLDYYHTGTTAACNQGGSGCLILHNGAKIKYWATDTLNGTGSTNALPFLVDPDGQVTDGTTNGPGKSVQFWLYYNGRLTDEGSIPAPGLTYSATANRTAAPARNPPWFSW